MPPLLEYWRAFWESCAASLLKRLMGLNDSFRSSGCIVGRWLPKKLVIWTFRGGSCFEEDSGLGLEWLLGCPPGWKVLAAGLGLNSFARTLNLEAPEVGVCEPLEGPVG